MNFKNFQQTNRNRCIELQGDVSIDDILMFAVALAGEAGEVCNDVKKIERIRRSYNFQHKQTKEELIKALGIELADVVCYAFLMASSINIDLENYIVRKFNQVSTENGCVTFIAVGDDGEYREFRMNRPRVIKRVKESSDRESSGR